MAYDKHMDQFQSTLPARGATKGIEEYQKAVRISIHAPREGSDTAQGKEPDADHHFNPRSPRGERPCAFPHSLHLPGDFNPRSPRGERQTGKREPDVFTLDFNPRSPRGERPSSSKSLRPICRKISIHAPREGSDLHLHTPSSQQDISIHAPREGSDIHCKGFFTRQVKFQSTLPARGATVSMSNAPI